MISILQANFPLLSEYQAQSAYESNHCQQLSTYQPLSHMLADPLITENGNLETLNISIYFHKSDFKSEMKSI